MKSTNHMGNAVVAVLWAVFASGCSSGAHAAATCQEPSGQTVLYLAQAAGCTQMDSTLSCCIKKNPTNAVEACGATAMEIAQVLKGLRFLKEASAAAEDASSADAKEGEDDPDEGWREHCQEMYVICRDQKKPRWVGPCDDCLRNCHGQRQWPFHWCHPKEG